MKKILFFLLFAVFSLGISAQAPSKKCPVCGLSIPKCQYKGKHLDKKPIAPAPTSQQPAKPVKQTETPSKAIDLGLPSGIKWAEWNIGASSPEQAGNYYAWGEISTKSDYGWATYFDSKDGENFKIYFIYNKQRKLGKNSVINTQRDVAYVKWGNGWHMPSADQIEELYKQCKSTWTTFRGVKGVRFTGPNGNSIFLPAAGYMHRKTKNDQGTGCYYWSGNLLSEDRKAVFMKSYNESDWATWTSWDYATCLYAGGGEEYIFSSEIYRRRGQSVRPVK